MNLRRAVTRLLLVTCFLLAVAWVTMQLMVNGGSFEAILSELRWQAEGKLREAVTFIQQKLGPMFEDVARQAQEFTGKLGTQ